MDFGASSVSSQPAPVAIADTRPSADVAASKKVREPTLAFSASGMVPNTSQAASVSKSMIMATGVEEADKSASVTAISPVERTLKPYGTPMLPEDIQPEDGDVDATEADEAEKEETQGNTTVTPD